VPILLREGAYRLNTDQGLRDGRGDGEMGIERHERGTEGQASCRYFAVKLPLTQLAMGWPAYR